MSAKKPSRKKPSRKKPSRKKPNGKKASRKTTSRSPASRAAAAKPAQVLEVLFRNEITPNRYDDSAAAARAGARKGGLLLRQVRGWRVAESLQRLLEQVNQMAPDRNKASDGSIGDPRHQSRASDHNPWVIDGNIGVVTARDITHDPRNGCDAQKIAELDRGLQGSAGEVHHLEPANLQLQDPAVDLAQLHGSQPSQQARPHFGAPGEGQIRQPSRLATHANAARAHGDGVCRPDHRATWRWLGARK